MSICVRDAGREFWLAAVLIVWSMSYHCTLQQDLCWSLLQMYDSLMVTLG